MSTHFLQVSFRILAIDLIGNLLHFPVWWYSKGLIQAFRVAIGQIRSMANYFALPILVRYWFKPMFGQSDFWSRIISFGVRTVQLIVVSIGQLVWTILVFAVFLLWPVLPIVIVANLFFQLGVFSDFSLAR